MYPHMTVGRFEGEADLDKEIIKRTELLKPK